MESLVRLAGFALFVLAGSALHRIEPPRWRQAWVSMLAIVMMVGYLTLFLSAREAWPLMVSRHFADDSRRIPSARRAPLFVLFSAAGHEWEADPASWAPLGVEGLWRWLENTRWSVEQGERAARFLYGKAAPRTRPAHPDERAVGLRIYWLHWTGDGVPPDAGACRRELVIEHRE